jgi:uncharacterized OB-fold protein
VPGSRYLKPLFAQDANAPDEVVFNGGACACGHVFFPMQTYGCELCGRHGPALQPMPLRGRGQLVASALVRIHPDKARAVPFTVVEVVLEQGPTVRTLLAEAESDPAPGAQMRATLVRVDASETEGDIFDLRFVAVEPTSAGG